ncbi:MAG TPA: adenylate/guanylate cyclase domain-containing protein [Candidatus Limnocylindria bacterium]|nr:adenylate/guanylate cyclase domain-containing protein [Candidatus Limnocylindria bacterium]
MTGKERRTRVLAAICGIVTAMVTVVYAWRGAPAHDELLLGELWAKNLFIVHGRTLGIDTNLVFIGITQPSYGELLGEEDVRQLPISAELTNSFPWSREVWAYAVEKLLSSGAKVVALDLIFAAPAKGDAKLREILDRYADRVVIGANLIGGDSAEGASAGISFPTDLVIDYSDAAAPWRDDRVGFVNYVADADDRVRKATFQIRGETGLPPDGRMRSLVARMLDKIGKNSLLPVDEDARLFRFSGPPGTYVPIPFYEIFLPAFWTNNFAEGRFFRDKIILIGPAANIFHDEHRTPFPGPTMLGPEIHLNVMAAARRGEFLGETSKEADTGIILGTGLLAWLLTWLVRAPVRRLLAALVLTIGYILLCHFSFDHANFVLLGFSPLLVLNVSTLGGFAYEFVLERREKNRTRRTLERYVSKDVVRELLDNPQTYLNTLQGVRKPVTILFSDIRGFTTMTEGADPAQLVTQLNEYFKEMVGIVFAEHGSLDKFIGDAVMALWGSITTEGVERDAQHAVAAALAMRQSLARLNINWQQRGMKPLAFGIGVNHGDVIVGNLGSEEKMEVSVIGDAVNLASRLEGLTKEYKLDLLLGETMASLVTSRFILRTVDSVQVKGKTKPVHVFTVVADKEAGGESPPWLPCYEEGIKCYHSRKFVEALAAFADCVREQPDDYLSELYLKRCQELVANPPSPDWNTVFVMKSK